MSRLMDEKSWSIKNSDSVLAFETTGGGHWEAWDRYLIIEGKKAFHIGNICGTCEFFFERLKDASRSVSPGEVSSVLEKGVSELDEDLLSKVSPILPDGDYTVSLMEVNPCLVAPGTAEDYFIDEQIRVWGIDSFGDCRTTLKPSITGVRQRHYPINQNCSSSSFRLSRCTGWTMRRLRSINH